MLQQQLEKENQRFHVPKLFLAGGPMEMYSSSLKKNETFSDLSEKMYLDTFVQCNFMKVYTILNIVFYAAKITFFIF